MVFGNLNHFLYCSETSHFVWSQLPSFAFIDTVGKMCHNAKDVSGKEWTGYIYLFRGSARYTMLVLCKIRKELDCVFCLVKVVLDMGKSKHCTAYFKSPRVVRITSRFE